MTDNITEARPDVDIEQDVNHVFTKYPPLAHDRSRMDVTIADGVVTATGHVKTAQARHIFAREVKKIEGVKAVHTDKLYDDDALRIQSGQVTPFGVYTSVSYGAVILTGSLPEGMTEADVIAAVEKIDGVRKVIPNFR